MAKTDRFDYGRSSGRFYSLSRFRPQASERYRWEEISISMSNSARVHGPLVWGQDHRRRPVASELWVPQRWSLFGSTLLSSDAALLACPEDPANLLPKINILLSLNWGHGVLNRATLARKYFDLQGNAQPSIMLMTRLICSVWNFTLQDGHLSYYLITAAQLLIICSLRPLFTEV